VGDSPSKDVAGAIGAGIAAILVRRHGERPDEEPADARYSARAAAEIVTLAELPHVL
jgi:FMN phosphatase YigB (HAD superfamily)